MYTVYTKTNCTFCDQAKALLRSKGLPFNEIRIVPQQTGEANTILLEDFKAQYPNQRTAPLVLKDHFAIGGFQELRASLTESKNVLLG